MTKLPFDWKKIQDSLIGMAKIGSRELKRGVSQARTKVNSIMLVQRKKDLFSELGQICYETYHLPTGSAEDLTKALSEAECVDIFKEISDIDEKLAEIKQSA